MTASPNTTPVLATAGRPVPPIRRSTLLAEPWTTNPLARAWQALRRPFSARLRQAHAARHDVIPPDTQGNWRRAGLWRRGILLLMVIAQSALATVFMVQTLPYHGGHWLEVVVLAFFVLLFAWVSVGFWTAIAGFLLLLRGHDRYSVSAAPPSAQTAATPLPRDGRTALVMPIANEDVARVFAGLRATYESVQRTGEQDHFDLYILSDSADPDIATAELCAWRALVDAVGGEGRIFYRRRRRRVKRKSGNIDDFCRRWGANYRYMVVLDADSVMTGQSLVSLVRMMEYHPGAGIIQSPPRAIGRDTFYARVQQFATRVYGPLFTAGLHFWQLGESHYWGHNAIIRLAPFMRHCALAPLPGRGSLSGEILSHDFVEAALMRRAGWAVWIAYDLPGSYEELPPNLLDELKRDRRWCQGNLMNFRLFFVRGLHPVHRVVFLTGMMSYMSAPLWFTFLMLSTALLAVQTLLPVTYFTQPHQLVPTWPQWHPDRALALFAATSLLLFLPKLLAVVRLWPRRSRGYGGAILLTVSMLLEVLFSMLLAPVRMMFHTKFVNAAFLGWKVVWKSPPREDSQTTWGEAIRRHGVQTLFAAAWGVAVYLLNPTLLAWMSPIIGSLLLAVPVSVYSSRLSLGRACKRQGLFLIPEEIHAPVELRATRRYTRQPARMSAFAEALEDPVVLPLLTEAAPSFHRDTPLQQRSRERRLKALQQGVAQLDDRQRLAVLDNGRLLREWHERRYRSEAVPAMP
ncbi:glucans biosynthesis glucosyltransferase MdoH [Frateuria defendens]|uniref:glucans biosynthesis glucosyltransferase MdoH n=1 Tax=Frateuria defendens TaxID=2219559 RepID=UPI00069E972F|nr:glucans biosynthesis glucosyltransferase MdoH [Frateuria defendens]